MLPANRQIRLKIWLELVWWVFTGMATYLLIHPITEKIYQYPFLWINAAFIIVFITFARYTFLLKYTWLAHLEIAKLIFVLAGVSIIYFLMNGFSEVRTYINEEGITGFMRHLPLEDQNMMGKYIENQIVFFGVGSVISAFILIIRLIISIWRGRNNHGV